MAPPSQPPLCRSQEGISGLGKKLPSKLEVEYVYVEYSDQER